MGETENDDGKLEKFYHDVQLRLAYDSINNLPDKERSDSEKEKILSLFSIEKEEYAKHEAAERLRLEQEEKNAKLTEARRRAELENSPAYWKNMYENMVRHEAERKAELQSMFFFFICLGVTFIIVWFQ